MRQEKLIAIAFVVAALIFSTVTYSFAHRVIVGGKQTPARVQTVDYGAYRVAPCGAVVVRPMVPRYCGVPAVRMCNRYMMLHHYGKPVPHGRCVWVHKRPVAGHDLQKRAYGVRYHYPRMCCPAAR